MTAGDVNGFSWIQQDPLFEKGDSRKIWLKYCGFLDLSLTDFMVIQRSLLQEQIDLVYRSRIGRSIVRGSKPGNVSEFREFVPLTTYDDYEPFLGKRMDEAMPSRPVVWAHTSGRAGLPKWAPYTQGLIERLASDTLSAFILSAARHKGDVRLRPGAKVVLNLPPVPYTTGIMALVAGHRISYQSIPPLEMASQMDFQQRIEQGFKMSLQTGADYAASIAIVLAKVGESFANLGDSSRTSLAGLHPVSVLRLLRAKIKSKLAGRPMLPKDIWSMKGLVCGGTDVSILRDQIEHYWGVHPLDAYVATESGFMATQSWNKKWMTLVPYSNFFEFIPEEERRKELKDTDYRPRTVLLDEVEPGKVYEIVFTNFHGGPFLRYRIGDLIRVQSIGDEETGVSLPQVSFESRADDIIDMAGFSRLDERTIWQAIQNTNVPYADWTIRKEVHRGQPCLHLYIELQGNGLHPRDMASRVDEQLACASTDYRDLRTITMLEAVKVTLLGQGTMKRYLAAKQAAGADLSHLKPAHINAPDSAIEELLKLSDSR